MYTLDEVVSGISWVDSVVQDLIERNRRLDILNERFYHHMFSSYLSSAPNHNVQDTWLDLDILPEYPTHNQFARANIILDDPEFVFNHAIGQGRDGNIDFRIVGDPPISVEWKGPRNCPQQDMAEVFIKLLSQDYVAGRLKDQRHIKIIAAIFLTKRGQRNHAGNLIARMQMCLQFACEVYGIQNLQDYNLHAYVRSRFEGGYHNIWWGPINNANLV